MVETGVQDGMQEPEQKKHGLAHLFAASGYSAAGLRRALGESAFRQEVVFFIAALALFVFIGATIAEFLGLTIIFLLMFAVEALNTAIEELVDRVSPEVSRTGKHAKDLGSFAVFCTISAASLYIAWVVLG
jgi:diacylglycerol kinase (ATP)